ncbi:phosphoesterase [Xylocopilactobacillus apis]|uniref:Phosphoesterase n=2 Tax=Xylocopilactobacillus apis TaxID=2932183 RepID=A0AAU9CW74_9LACO|nr:phosphoesterase [Xylocopilactobacillus apis]
MKILICSDTHGDEEILLEKLSKYPDFDHYFYLGDSELAETNLLFEKFIAVSGNMDYGEFPATKLISDQGIKFFLTHGHLFGVNSGLQRLVSEAQKLEANIVCYGHTHQLSIRSIDGILFINPGSISQPRNFISERGTYVILEITETEYLIYCYNRKDQLLDIEKNPLIVKRNNE